MRRNSLYLQRGLTLLELVVVMAMIGILLFAVFGFINPQRQLKRAHDGQITSDLSQVSVALDTYYNDTSCYPTSLPFGESWQVGITTYMPKVPESPTCSGDPSTCYIYLAEGSCPQWNVIFARLSDIATGERACSLQSSCLPQNSNEKWTCSVSGNVDCSAVSRFRLPDEGEACPPTQRHYACTGAPLRCNSVPSGTGTYCASDCDGAC